jgi:hypothetical protein
MNDLLHRVELHSPDQARAILTRNLLPWIGEQLTQGRELVVEARLLEDDITDKQRGFLHGVVLTEIALYARPGGVQHDMKTWKEYFRAEWLGFKVVTSVNPITGRKVRRRVRVSTEDLGIRAMAEYIDRIIAFAATDLGVTVSEPLPPELRGTRRKRTAAEMADQSTGEIPEGAMA